jgi:arsenate reductase (glutaredoxin)
MKNTIYHLSVCSTNRRIIAGIPNKDKFEFRDIKKQPITLAELEELYALAGNYESLFSKRATLYKTRNLKMATLTEADYKNLILEHYSFLNRPVIVYNNQIYVGNRPKTIDLLYKKLQEQA